MNSIGKMAKATAMVAALAICPQVSSAEGFTGVDFLNWPETEQRAYMSAQLVMASSIVSREKPTMAQCISDKFYSQTGLADTEFSNIQSTIHEYNSFHPSSVIVILIEKACGHFY